MPSQRGATWSSPEEGLGAGYLVSVAIDPGDPEVVVAPALAALALLPPPAGGA